MMKAPSAQHLAYLQIQLSQILPEIDFGGFTPMMITNKAHAVKMFC
jgi:hypothetical protein